MRGDGSFAVDIFVEDVLIAKGEGLTPSAAEEDAVDDFIERCLEKRDGRTDRNTYTIPDHFLKF